MWKAAIGALKSASARAIGAVVARFVHTEEVTGSNPVSPTPRTGVTAASKRPPVSPASGRRRVGPVQRVAGGWARGARFETEAETWLVEIARVIRMVSIPDHEGALMNTLAL